MTPERPAESAEDPAPSFPFTPLGERISEPVPYNGRSLPSAPRMSWALTFFVTLMILWLVVPFLAERIQYSITRGQQRAALEVAREGLGELPLNSLSAAYQLVSKSIAPSVVHIDVRSAVVTDVEGERSHGPRNQGAGSGVIVDSIGHVLTNYHVIHGADSIRVTLSDDRVVRAEVIGEDPGTDLALLKINATGLIAAQWGDSDQLDAGALVWAVGSPFGFRQSITFGIISAKNREMAEKSGQLNQLKSNYADFLQTDAAVNPGNSGGPLVDANGQVVGINTAIVGTSFSGASFAIPSSVARTVYERLKTMGEIERGWLGISPMTVDKEVAARRNLAVDYGALVRPILRDDHLDTPAGDAGIRSGDIIVRWDGQRVNDAIALIRLVAVTVIGGEVDVVVVRGSERLTLQVKVGKRPKHIDIR